MLCQFAPLSRSDILFLLRIVCHKRTPESRTASRVRVARGRRIGRRRAGKNRKFLLRLSAISGILSLSTDKESLSEDHGGSRGKGLWRGTDREISEALSAFPGEFFGV
jgi:hypothetical protein